MIKAILFYLFMFDCPIVNVEHIKVNLLHLAVYLLKTVVTIVDLVHSINLNQVRFILRPMDSLLAGLDG